jgi:hypothetical protein
MLFVTVGLFLLTALYVGMVALIKYLSPVECLDDSSSCQSEAVDNTILNWASDFFVAFWCFIFALHLSFSGGPNADVRKMAILSQIFMGGAFVAVGVGHWLYPNSGLDDNSGMLGYWILWIMFAIFFTSSAFGMSHFAVKASGKRNIWAPLAGLLLFLSLCGFFTGSIWCSTKADLQANEIEDNIDPADEIHVCFDIAYYSMAAMNFTYALLWLPVGLLLKAASKQQPVVVLGLPTPIAAIVAIVTQWTVGSILVVILFFTDLFSPKLDYFDVSNVIYGTVLYHWAMLVTLYCLHNLSYGLPLRYDDSEEEENGPSPLTWEWWVAMVAGVVPEPKQKTNKKEATKEIDEENNNIEKMVNIEFIEEIDA